MSDFPDFSDDIAGDVTPWPLIAAYCTGELSPVDREALDAWIAVDPDRSRELQVLADSWRGMQAPERPQTEARTLWGSVAKHTVHATPEAPAFARAPTSKVVRPTQTAPRWKWGAGIAAAGLVAALLVWGGLSSLPHSGKVAATVPDVTHTTGTGERTRFKMPDGTVVQLAPRSEIRYASDFSKSRMVHLDGEAVFTVTHLSGTPFIVESHGTQTTVLGTTFSVRAYAQDGVVRVAVAEGRVQVDDGPVLALGDVSTILLENAPTVQRGIDVIPLFGWTQGRLVFERTPLAQAVHDLERWYGLRISVPSASLAARPVTAEFENLPATAVLDVLADILQARYIRDDNHITFIALGDS